MVNTSLFPVTRPDAGAATFAVSETSQVPSGECLFVVSGPPHVKSALSEPMNVLTSASAMAVRCLPDRRGRLLR